MDVFTAISKHRTQRQTGYEHLTLPPIQKGADVLQRRFKRLPIKSPRLCQGIVNIEL